MDPKKPTPEQQIQNLQDMLAGLENQRNAAQNENVHLSAQLRAALRRIAELEKPAEASAPVANGHDAAEARA